MSKDSECSRNVLALAGYRQRKVVVGETIVDAYVREVEALQREAVRRAVDKSRDEAVDKSGSTWFSAAFVGHAPVDKCTYDGAPIPLCFVDSCQRQLRCVGRKLKVHGDVG